MKKLLFVALAFCVSAVAYAGCPGGTCPLSPEEVNVPNPIGTYVVVRKDINYTVEFKYDKRDYEYDKMIHGGVALGRFCLCPDFSRIYYGCTIDGGMNGHKLEEMAFAVDMITPNKEILETSEALKKLYTGTVCMSYRAGLNGEIEAVPVVVE